MYLYHLYTNGAGWNNLSPCTYVMIVEWQDKQDNSSNSSFTETVSNSLTICHNNWQTQTYPTKTKLNVSPYLLPLLNWILKLSGAIPIWGKVTTMSNDNSKTIWWQVWYPLFKGENTWIGRLNASQAVDQSSWGILGKSEFYGALKIETWKLHHWLGGQWFPGKSSESCFVG